MLTKHAHARGIVQVELQMPKISITTDLSAAAGTYTLVHLATQLVYH